MCNTNEINGFVIWYKAYVARLIRLRTPSQIAPIVFSVCVFILYHVCFRISFKVRAICVSAWLTVYMDGVSVAYGREMLPANVKASYSVPFEWETMLLRVTTLQLIAHIVASI